MVCTGVCKEGSGENRQRERPYRMALSHGVMGGRRACVLTELSQGAVEGGGEPRGESAPVVSVLTSTQGHRVTTAALGVGIVVVACLSRLAPSRAGAHAPWRGGAPPKVIGLRAPLWLRYGTPRLAMMRA